MMPGTLYFYAVTLSFFLGIALASATSIGYSEALLACVVASALVGMYFYRGKHLLHAVCCCILLGSACGVFRFEYGEHRASHDLDVYEEQQVVVFGVVVREPDTRERTTHLVVRVDAVGTTSEEGMVLVLHERLSPVVYGDRVEVTGMLSQPTSFDTDFGRQFHYREYLRAQGIDHVMTYPDVRVISHGAGWRFVAALLVFKHAVSASIETALRAPEAGLALGLVLGERQALGKDLLAVFRNAGLIHIVVLSGYNIAIMIEACMRLLTWIPPRTRSVIGGGIIFCFVVMVGPTATVLRAAVMASLVLIARATGRTYAILRALVVAGVLMVLVNPYLLMYDPGFQLSFLATLGLIALVPMLERACGWLPSCLGAKDYLLSTIAAQVMTLPLIMYAMGSVSIFAVVANVLVLPVIPVAMLLTAITGGVGMLSEAAAFVVGYPTYLILHYVMVQSSFFGTLPYGMFVLPPFSFTWVIALYIGMGSVMGLWAAYKKSPPKVVPSMDSPMPF
ncbi:MAG: hypothetical protein RLZZ234_360 [Candidatus Parcubacteria bacterium]|jgi:competence protein ComEC